MFKNQKKLFICFALVALILGSESNVYAAATGQNITNPISVQSVNTASSSIALNISTSGTASISAGVVGRIGTSKIEITVKLQKYNSSTKSWKKIKSWETTSNSTFASLSKTYTLTSKGTYRAKLTSSVWKDGKAETVTVATGSKKY